MKRRIGWIAILVATIVLLGIGGVRNPGAATTPERVRAISETTKCPVCVGESVAQSNASSSVIIREEIARQVRAGRTDDEVRVNIEKQYVGAIQLTPPATGSGSLVWILPTLLLVALGALAVRVFRRTGP